MKTASGLSHLLFFTFQGVTPGLRAIIVAEKVAVKMVVSVQGLKALEMW